ncbi:hypothetical protein D3C78_1540180 [compost metagenome]
MCGTDHQVMARHCRLQGSGIENVHVLAHHTRTRAEFRGVAGDGGDAVTTTQGLFQQLAAGTAGGTNDCDLAHEQCSSSGVTQRVTGGIPTRAWEQSFNYSVNTSYHFISPLATFALSSRELSSPRVG